MSLLLCSMLEWYNGPFIGNVMYMMCFMRRWYTNLIWHMNMCFCVTERVMRNYICSPWQESSHTTVSSANVIGILLQALAMFTIPFHTGYLKIIISYCSYSLCPGKYLNSSLEKAETLCQEYWCTLTNVTGLHWFLLADQLPPYWFLEYPAIPSIIIMK